MVEAVWDERVLLSGGAISDAQGPLFPAEEEAIRYAVEKRRAEFRAGRTYARTVLTALGIEAQEVGVSGARTPIWPQGIVGSISHDDVYCVAMAARSTEMRSVGVDIEPDVPLDSDLVDLICSAADLEHRVELEAALNVDLPKLVFSAKESTYKAYFPLTHSPLEFHDVALAFSPAEGAFTAVLADSVPAIPGRGRTVHGRIMRFRDRILAVACIEA